MKKILSFVLLLTALSFHTYAQGPTGDDPIDPGGDIFSYQNGYSEGATEAINLNIVLTPAYGGTVDFIEWHQFDPTVYNNLGPVVDYFSPGIKVPVIKWSVVPSFLMFYDPEIYESLMRLDQARDGSIYTEGYFAGFNDNVYYYPW